MKCFDWRAGQRGTRNEARGSGFIGIPISYISKPGAKAGRNNRGGIYYSSEFLPSAWFFFYVVQCKKVKRCTNRAGIVAVVSEKRRGLRQVRACTGSDGKPGIARHSHVVHEHRHKHQENAGLLSSDSCVSKTPLLNTRPHAEPQEGLRFCY